MKPFTIKNKEHKDEVMKRIQRDLRALVVYEFEDADEESFEISFESYINLFGENPLEIYWKQRREYLDKINEKRNDEFTKILNESML